MTSRNEITGDMIAVGARHSEKYDSGWERIFGKSPNAKTIAAMQELDRGNGERFESVEALMADLECQNCCGRGWVETWGPEGEGAEDCGECSGK